MQSLANIVLKLLVGDLDQGDKWRKLPIVTANDHRDDVDIATFDGYSHLNLHMAPLRLYLS